MNRTEFMNQLEILLQNISDGEKEEALQYYNDYFDDAGAENEQKVIEALGNPARVAENIRRELLENQGAKSSTDADKAVVEYGKADTDGQSENVPAATGPASVAALGGAENRNISDSGNGASWQSELPAESRESGGGPGSGGSPGSGGGPGFGGSPGSGGAPGFGGSSGSGGKPGMSGGAIAAITILLVFASPFIIGLCAVLFGILAAWFAVILSFGVVVLSLFLVLFVLLIVGGMCIPVDPLAGVALIGGGLVCGGVGILFLMLTVAMAGIVTPAVFRGIGHLFRLGRKANA